MPKQISINETQNPTRLTMPERQLAIDVLRSMEESVTKERVRLKKERPRYRGKWSVEDEVELRQKVYRSAFNQLAGRVKTTKGTFSLTLGGSIPDVDMEYVRASLGME